MSDTPRTDAACEVAARSCHPAAVVDLARTLERKVAELRAELTRVRGELMGALGRAEALQERSEGPPQPERLTTHLRALLVDMTQRANLAEQVTAETRAENAALRADAERYRWLRNAARTVDYSAWLDVGQSMFQTGCRHSGGQLDEEIDNFIARQPHSQSGGSEDREANALQDRSARLGELHQQSMEGSGQ